MSHKNHHQRRGERGSALVYILIAIALLAALTVSFMQPSGNQTQSQNAFKAVSELQSQADFIRSAVHECVLSHPGGDITARTTHPNVDIRYPLDPTSTHFNGATVGAATDNYVRNIRCPGNPGDNQNHAPIFGGSTGKFLPPAPSLFNEWRWYNDVDGVFFWISTDNADAFIDSALEKVQESFAACEAGIVAGGADLDVAGTHECQSGGTCYRIWMIRKTPCT